MSYFTYFPSKNFTPFGPAVLPAIGNIYKDIYMDIGYEKTEHSPKNLSILIFATAADGVMVFFKTKYITNHIITVI